MWHWIDLTILGIIALSVITGVFRGFIKELIALCVWVLAIWLSFNYSQMLDPWLQGMIQDQTIRSGIAFVLVMIATLILGGISNAILGFILKSSGLSGMDRILGMGFGFIRGVFIVALIMLVIKMTSLPHERYSSDTLLYAKFEPVVNWMYSVVPDSIKQGTIFEKKTAALPLKLTEAVDLANDFELSDG